MNARSFATRAVTESLRIGVYFIAIALVVLTEPIREHWNWLGDFVWLANTVLVLFGGRLTGDWVVGNILERTKDSASSDENC
jgi:hypothetical protein